MPANDKPAVDFNFDTFERDGKKPPFGVVIGGKRYEATDPRDLDYREFAVAEVDPNEMLRLLFPDDHKAILENKIPVMALTAFVERVLDHYDMRPTDASQES